MASDTSKNKPHFRQILLMAPDVDAGLFRQMASWIRRNADRVTFYASKRDEALNAAPTLSA